MAKRDELLARIDADIAKLQEMRAYVEANTSAEPAAEPPKKRGRKKKPGLPPADVTVDALKF